MLLKIALVLIASSFCILFSCKEKEPSMPVREKWSNEKSVALQQELATQELINIRLFLAQHRSWVMSETGTGLQYFIYEGKEGKQKPKSGDKVEVGFEIKGLDGELYYTATNYDSRVFLFEKSDVETGIQEMLQIMPVGSKAHVIIPSHLAHGLLGDNDKIPPLTCLVIDLNFLAILKK